jgi:osmotically-inducible protein OsmY
MKTDAQLKKDVFDELAWDAKVNPADIGIIVKDGVVTLIGHLGSFAEKYAAEKAAQRVKGVRVIATELAVKLGTPFKRSDSEIAGAAQRALDWNTFVPGTVQAKVEKGWLTLKGDVPWDFQRKEAARILRNLNGVLGVSNFIEVTPTVSAGDLKKGIQAALERHADREAEKIQVLVDGARVTLRGKVDSFADMNAAVAAAWSASGVASVTNELAIA